MVLGYAVRSSSGEWSNFVTLSYPYNGSNGVVELSHQANLILVSDTQASMLVNPIDGSVTPITQLISPSAMTQFPNGLYGQAIDDRGDILATAGNGSGELDYYLLTAPAAVPEPTTLVTLTVAAVGFALRDLLQRHAGTKELS